jgi:membrane protease YdiL (CAAX protease family)
MPDEFLNLIRTRPLLWTLIVILYPLLWVLPQGIVYRAFLFHRYRELVSQKALLIIGTLAFSLAHLPFANVWALGLTLVGGFLFNRTYCKSGSMLLSSLEHVLYGWLIFTLGLGKYFVHGTMQLSRVFGGG